jgi:O-antigen biosynthesis protein
MTDTKEKYEEAPLSVYGNLRSTESTRDGLERVFLEHRGKTVDKWEHYLAIYARELAPFLEARQPIRLLEIGVQNGGSLEIWLKYLPEGSAVTGVDIDPATKTLNFEGNIKVKIADAADSSKLAEVLGTRSFDIIIDDGSHMSGDVVSAFYCLFDRLALGGKFIIEDLHASYWPSHGGGFRSGKSAVDFFKNLVDALNVDHIDRTEQVSRDTVAELRHFALSLARVTFYDSVAVIEKLPSPKTVPYRRVLSGRESRIVDPFAGIIALPSAKIEPLIFADEQKQHIDAMMLDHLKDMEADTQSATTEMARLHGENVELTVRLKDLEQRSLNRDSEAQRANVEVERLTVELEQVRAGSLREISDYETTLASATARVAAENAQLAEQLNELRSRYLQEMEARPTVFEPEVPSEGPQSGAGSGDRQGATARLAAEHREDLAHTHQLEAQLQAVYTSSSWRLTGPVRFIGRLVHRAIGVIRAGKFRASLILRIPPPACTEIPLAESWEKSAILEADLFDEQWYLRTYRDVAESGLDPLGHYLSSGAAEGRTPNRLFDSTWYLRTYPDVAKGGVNPLAHYASFGAKEGREPHPDFSGRWYLEQNPEVAEAGINPLTHYLREGRTLGIEPFPPYRRYQEHVARERILDVLEQKELLQHINVMTYRPRFIVLIDGGDQADSSASIECCEAQLYPDWQIVRSRQEVLQCVEASDPNRSYLIWIAPGDRLSNKALYACAAALNADPAADLVYFDEDEWHPEGPRRPFYKPDWSPDYLEAVNYIGPAAGFRLSRVNDLLLCADSPYDFTLRFLEVTTRVQHVRQVLLHRRAGLSLPITTEQAEADIRAVYGRLQRTGRSGTVVPNIPGFASYDAHLVQTSKPLVSIIIPTAGKVVKVDGREIDLVVNCIDTILARSTYRELEFIVIDNGDFDRRRLGHIATDQIKFTSFREAEFNVAKKLNIGAALASGSLFLLLNDDIEPLVGDWIERMMEHFQKPHVGVVGAKLLYPDFTTQHLGVVLYANNPDHVRRSASRDDTGYYFSSCSVRNYHAVTGAVMMTTKELYWQVGGYTEALAISFNDVDFCLKVGERGLSVVYAPKAELTHFESQSREAKLNLSELIYFKRRWAHIVSDSFYNELNLTVAPPTFDVYHNARLI